MRVKLIEGLAGHKVVHLHGREGFSGCDEARHMIRLNESVPGSVTASSNYRKNVCLEEKLRCTECLGQRLQWRRLGIAC
jgi:hypothetical protein